VLACSFAPSQTRENEGESVGDQKNKKILVTLTNEEEELLLAESAALEVKFIQ
jgi:hypothetical protein